MANMLDFIVQGSSRWASLDADSAKLSNNNHVIELLCPTELIGKKLVSVSFEVWVKTKTQTFGIWSAPQSTFEDISLAPGARATVTLKETIAAPGLVIGTPTDVDKSIRIKNVTFLATGATLDGGLITPNPEGETITKDEPGAITPPAATFDARTVA